MKESFTLNILIDFKKPCHIGDSKGNQLKDKEGKPYLPNLVLKTQIEREANRFALALKRKNINLLKVSNGITVSSFNFYKIRNEEFFKTKIYFSLVTKKEDLDLILASLKSRQNIGIGANTSSGFGYNKLFILKINSEDPKEIIEDVNPKTLDLATSIDLDLDFKKLKNIFIELKPAIFKTVKMNWISWARFYSLGPFYSRDYYKTELEERITSFRFRGWLRNKLNEGFKTNPKMCLKKPYCPTCNLMGTLGFKSRLIIREFNKVIYIIGENLHDKEKEALEDIMPLELISIETLEDYI